MNSSSALQKNSSALLRSAVCRVHYESHDSKLAMNVGT